MNVIYGAAEILKNLNDNNLENNDKILEYKTLFNNRPSNCNSIISNTPKKSEKKILIEKIIGEGTFGKVFIGYYEGDTNPIAIKYEKLNNKYQNREIEILKLMRKTPCDYVINMIDYSIDNENEYQISMIIMDYYPINLRTFIIKSCYKKKMIYLKSYTEQLLKALDHIHNFNIIHRDIKPDNILVNGNRVCLADFGTSKIFNGTKSTPYISTRYYRAPECILENEFYNMSIDIWAMGCVFAEILLTKPLFMGKSNSDQLYRIFKIMGFPSKEILKTLNPDLDLNNHNIIKETPSMLNEIFKDIAMPKHFYSVLRSMVTLNRFRKEPENILKKTYFRNYTIKNIL